MADKRFQVYMEKLMADAAKKQAALARDMSYLISSDVGESFTTLITELLAQLKDEHVFAEDGQRSEIKGSIIAIQTLLSMILDFAKQHVEEDNQPRGWASASDEDAAEQPPAQAPAGRQSSVYGLPWST
jgi:hypothetical protein